MDLGEPSLAFISSGRRKGPDGSLFAILPVVLLNYVARRYIDIRTAISEEIKRLQDLRETMRKRLDIEDPARKWVDIRLMILINSRKQMDEQPPFPGSSPEA